jgi:ribosomal protein L37AE/L43A
MVLMPLSTGHEAPRGEELECPHCRRLGDGEIHRGVARCTDCGYHLIASTRQSEVDAWQRLYERPERPRR